MENQKILVTGANGQLGQELKAAVSASANKLAAFSKVAPSLHPPFDFIFLTRNDLSLGEPGSIRAIFDTHRPSYCINCAAYTAVDKAESEKDLAFRINGEAVGELAATCQSFDTRLIHISTDYVFDGRSAIPLKEQDPTDPVNVYGASKLLGEQLAMQRHAQTVILRTSWVYSEFGNNFVRTMLRLMKEKEFIRVVDDQLGSPTYAADLSSLILRIIGGPAFIPGIYHYSNEGEISWYQFAIAIATLTGSACRVDPVPTAQYPTPAKRPHYSLLDKTLIRQTYGIGIPAWKDSLAVCLGKLQAASY